MLTNEILYDTAGLSNKYIENIVTITSKQDKDACLRFLTIHNDNFAVSPRFSNGIIEYSDCLICLSSQEDPKEIVAFSFVKLQEKKKGKILNILLACATLDNHEYGKMLAHSLYNFAITSKYPFIYVSPRTPELRKAFITYGFESIYGRQGIDEVLEKEIEFESVEQTQLYGIGSQFKNAL